MTPFTLRKWKKDDLDDLVQYANNYAIAKNLRNRFPHPYTTEDGKAFIEMTTTGNALIRAIEIDGKASGGIGLHPMEDIHCRNAEMGYWLAEPFWGQGIITEAIKQMVVIGFEELDIDRIFACPFGSNIGSQRALEKAGFILEARFEKTLYKFGKYEDELVYAVRRDA